MVVLAMKLRCGSRRESRRSQLYTQSSSGKSTPLDIELVDNDHVRRSRSREKCIPLDTVIVNNPDLYEDDEVESKEKNGPSYKSSTETVAEVGSGLFCESVPKRRRLTSPLRKIDSALEPEGPWRLEHKVYENNLNGNEIKFEVNEYLAGSTTSAYAAVHVSSRSVVIAQRSNVSALSENSDDVRDENVERERTVKLTRDSSPPPQLTRKRRNDTDDVVEFSQHSSSRKVTKKEKEEKKQHEKLKLQAERVDNERVETQSEATANPSSTSETRKSTKKKHGPGARTTKNSLRTIVDDFYHKIIRQLFQLKVQSGLIVDGMVERERDTDEEYKIWEECRDILSPSVPNHYYLDSSFWGSRFGNKNTSSKYKGGKVNLDYVKPGRLKHSAEQMKKVMREQWKLLPTSESGEQFCVFLLTSEVKVRGSDEAIKHSNVLLVRRCNQKLSYFVYEPLKRGKTYCLVNFLLKMKSLQNPDMALPSYNSFRVIFGRQNGSQDCFHRVIDWVAQLVNNKVDLAVNLYFQYDIGASKDGRVTLATLNDEDVY